MNKFRRGHLRIAADLLNQAKTIVDKALEEEQDALDGIPENLEFTERYEQMENAVDCLDTASDSISDAIEMVNGAME